MLQGDLGFEREKPPVTAEVRLPEHAIAGLISDVVTQFTLRQSPPLCRPVSQAWLPQGDLLIGCEEGQLLYLNVDQRRVHLLFQPLDDDLELASGVVGRDSKSSGAATASIMTNAVAPASPHVRPQGFRAMALHREGLYVGGEDGVLRLLDISSSSSECAVLSTQAVGAPISTLTFDADFARLAIGSPHALFLLDVGT